MFTAIVDYEMAAKIYNDTFNIKESKSYILYKKQLVDPEYSEREVNSMKFMNKSKYFMYIIRSYRTCRRLSSGFIFGGLNLGIDFHRRKYTYQ